MIKTFLVCANVLLGVNGFNIPNTHNKKQKPGTKFGRKSVIKNFSLENQDIQSPSILTKRLFDEVSNYGLPESYSDLLMVSETSIEGATLLTQNEQIKKLSPLIKSTGGNYDVSNFHVTKLIPSLVSGVLFNLIRITLTMMFCVTGQSV